MSLRILAIRPLKNTSTEILKRLQTNHFYRFYNGFSFFDSSDSEINNIIEPEGQPREVSVIRYNQEVAFDFYGDNISVSAIVGKNGSGKSSLLELL